MAKKENAAKTVTVEQIGSPIRRPAVQRQTLIGLASTRCTGFARWKIPQLFAA